MFFQVTKVKIIIYSNFISCFDQILCFFKNSSNASMVIGSFKTVFVLPSFRFDERDGVVRRQKKFPLVTNSMQALKHFDIHMNYLILRMTTYLSFALFSLVAHTVFCWKVQLSWRERGHVIAHCWLSYIGSVHSPLERVEQQSSPEGRKRNGRTQKSPHKCIFPRTEGETL